MTTIINRATRFRRVMHSAQVLPLARAHLVACLRAAGRVVAEQRDDHGVDLFAEEPAELVQPEVLVYAFGRVGQAEGGRAVDGADGGGVGAVEGGVVEGFEVLGQLEGAVDLFASTVSMCKTMY